MAHIKYKVDGRGVVSATADTVVNGRLMRIGVQGATTQEDGKDDIGVWAQVTMELFNKKESVQNGASELGREK